MSAVPALNRRKREGEQVAGGDGSQFLAVAVVHAHAGPAPVDVEGGTKLEHLLCPVTELRGFYGGALGVLENAPDVIAAFAGDERLVTLLGGEGEDVVVEDSVKLGRGWQSGGFDRGRAAERGGNANHGGGRAHAVGEGEVGVGVAHGRQSLLLRPDLLMGIDVPVALDGG